MTTPTGYSRLQILLHWAVAALIAQQYLFKDAIAQAWSAYAKGAAVPFDPLVAAHVFGGLLILLLVAGRLAIRLRRGAPALPEQEHPALQLVARATHWAFYAVLILLPVSGAMAWFGGVANAAVVHNVVKVVLLALLALHVAGALFQQFVLRTGILMRMVRSQP